MDGETGRAPEGLYRAVVESSAYGYVVVDQAGQISFANAGQEVVTGIPNDQVVGHNITEFVHPDDLARAVLAFAEVGKEWGDRQGEGVPLRLRITTSDGTWRHVEVGARNQEHDPAVRGVVLRIRPAEAEEGLALGLAALVSGAALEDVLEPVASALLWDLPGSEAVSICWDRTAGAPDGSGGGFQASVTARVGAGGGEIAWGDAAVAAASTGDLSWADRPDDGVGALWAQPVTVGDEQACVLVARSIPGEPWTTHRVALERSCAVVAVALERRRSDRMLEFAASHDDLTGLANRAELLSSLDVLLQHRRGAGRRAGDRDAGSPPSALAVIYVDLDGFKPVNDTHGHAAGDEVLRTMAHRLRSAARAQDVVGRLGGDEFAVVCLEVDDEAAARAVGERIVERLSEPMSVGGAVVSVGASVGVAFVAAGAEPRTSDQVLDLADAELYAAKRAGGGCLSLTTVS